MTQTEKSQATTHAVQRARGNPLCTIRRVKRRHGIENRKLLRNQLISKMGSRDDTHPTSFPADVPKLKVLKALNLLGFFCVREGNHIILQRENADGSKTPLTLPGHSRIKGSTLRRSCKKAGISRDDFLQAYYSV